MIRTALHPLARVALGVALATSALITNVLADTYPPGPGGCCPDSLTIINLRNPDAVPHPDIGDVVLGVGGFITGVTQRVGSYGFYMQMSNGLPYSGVAVFTGNEDTGPQVSDSVVVYGKVQHFSDTNGLSSPPLDSATSGITPEDSPYGDLFVRFVSSGNPEPPIHVGTLAEFEKTAGNPAGSPWLNMLVRLPGPLQVVAASGPNTFFVVDPSCTGTGCDTVYVDGGFLTEIATPEPDTILSSVSGIFVERKGNRQILPRSADDIVFAPTFTLPLDVSKAATQSRDPDIVSGVNGELFMAWSRLPYETVHSLSLDNTKNWSAAVPSSQQGVQPALAVTPLNKFGMLCAGVDELFFKQSTDGGFQLDPLITTVDRRATRYPALTVGSGEHFHAAWERTNRGVFYARSLDGGADFSAPYAIGRNGGGALNSMARICASSEDHVFVFWQYDDPGDPGVHRALYRRSVDAGATFSPERQVRDESDPLTSTLKLAYLGDAQIGSDGTLYVMGLDEEGGVAFLESTDDGVTFDLVSHLPEPAARGLLCPKSFAVGPGGEIHALVGECGTALYYTHSDDGGTTWDITVNVTSAISLTVGEPRGARIILDGAGVPVMVWFSVVGGSTEIVSSRLVKN